MRMRFLPFVTTVLASVPVFAQAPRAPRETASVTLEGKTVSIEYGRPSLKQRTIDSLVAQLPADRMWRAGVDQVTTLTTETDLLIGGKKIPAGKYSLYVHAPESGDWSLVINSDLGIALSKIYAKEPAARAQAPWPHLEGYKNIADKEVACSTMKSGTAAPPVETFTIAFKQAHAKDSATLQMSWGERSWSLDVKAAK